MLPVYMLNVAGRHDYPMVVVTLVSRHQQHFVSLIKPTPLRGNTAVTWPVVFSSGERYV